MRLAVVVTPKAGRDEVVGWKGAELQVRVTAAPEGGKANAAVVKAVAKRLGIAKSLVRVVRGDTARHKMLEIDNVADAEIEAAFGPPDPSLF